MDKIFKALADTNRRKILTMLMKKEMTVNELLAYFKISQSTLSCHLAVLRKAGLVENKIKWRERIYTINQPIMKDFVARLKQFIGESEVEPESDLMIRRRG